MPARRFRSRFSFEGENVLDPKASVLSGLREGNPLLIEEPHEVLARDVQEVGGLLRGQMFSDLDSYQMLQTQPGPT